MHGVRYQTVAHRTTARTNTDASILGPIDVVGYNQEVVDKTVGLDDIQFLFTSIDVLLCVLAALFETFLDLTNNLFPTVLLTIYFGELQGQLAKDVGIDLCFQLLQVLVHLLGHCLRSGIVAAMHLNEPLFHFPQCRHIPFGICFLNVGHVVIFHCMHLQVCIHILFGSSVGVRGQDALDTKVASHLNNTTVDFLLHARSAHFVRLHLSIQVVTENALELFQILVRLLLFAFDNTL